MPKPLSNRPSPAFWKKQSVLVTGGGGFLGCVVVEQLKESGCGDIAIPRASDYDFMQRSNVSQVFARQCPDIVIHLAAQCGGIGLNCKQSAKLFYDNAMIGLNVMEEARQYSLRKFISIGTVCSYPAFTAVPFKETDLWNGYPEPTNAAYGLAKKMLLVQGQAYRQQYGFNAIYLLLANLYGPGDHYDLETNHVIPALIRKCIEARENKADAIHCWGTGNVSREFLYVADAARAILLAAEHYDNALPVNVGIGQEVQITTLVQMIRRLTKCEARVRWDESKPSGQLRRCLDVSRAKAEFGFVAEMELEDGLRRTIYAYEEDEILDMLALAGIVE